MIRSSIATSRATALIAAFVGVAVVGCATQPETAHSSGAPVTERSRSVSVTRSVAAMGSEPRVLARNQRFLIYLPERGDSLQSIAQRYLGAEDRAWIIADFNNGREVKVGEPLVIPLQATNPTGVSASGYQTVPILCYHRFGTEEGKMVISPKAFAQQMEYLHANGYRVIRLSELPAFLSGKQQLPARAVVLSIDDGYNSMYHHAYPILKRYGFPATVFIYTDFVGARDALSWDQMKEMVASGLIDIEAHSKSHTNLALRMPGETESKYRERLINEAATPREVLKRKLNARVSSYAYPYGDANATVLEQLAKADYQLGLTVDPGGNAFFTPPLLLRRTMVLGDQDLDAFKAHLQVFMTADLRTTP